MGISVRNLFVTLLAMITFYDIHSTLPQKAWSSLSWNVRYTLNYKSLPYKTEYIEYPDIKETCQKLGIPYTSIKPDGSPVYTLPAIYDSNTGLYIADSFTIAQYLDVTYPETPTVIFTGTEEFTLRYINCFIGKFSPLYMCLIRHMCRIFTPRTTEYLSRRPYFGRSWAELMMFTDEEQWDAVSVLERDLSGVCEKMKETQMDIEGRFVLGDSPSFADFTAAGMFLFVRTIVGEESETWEEILSWDGGKWRRLLEDLKEWEVVI